MTWCIAVQSGRVNPAVQKKEFIMTQEQWTAVDHYLQDHLIAPDPILEAALQASVEAGLPAINVAPNQGKLLMLLAQLTGATRILEIGTLGGYSTLWLARALPADGKIVTLELDPHHAQVAQANFERAGVAHQMDLRLGSALDSLAQIAQEGQPPFDVVFIDADKANMPDYFKWSLQLTHPAGLIIMDNVVRSGNVIDANSEDVNVQGVRRLMTLLTSESRVTVTAVQTVGSKGYDGFALARVNP